MKRKLLSLLMVMCVALAGFAIPAYGLQDPIILTVDSAAYGPNQDTLVVKAWFVNTSNKTVFNIQDVQLEILKGSTVIASGLFNIFETKEVNIAIGDAAPWEFVLKNPVKGQDLTGVTANSKLVYNQGKSTELPAGKKIYFKGFPIQFDVKPAVINGRLMIPARAVFEKMGATVEWNEASRSLNVNRGSRQVVIFIDNPVMTVSGTPVRLDVPATIVDGRTLVPLRAIANALGAGITYGELNEMAVIYE